MIKLETHAHTGGSYCADWTTENIILEYKKAGYGAIVVTNHYCKNSFDIYSDRTDKGYVDYFFDLIYQAQEFGKKYGLKIFYGLETRLLCINTEFMLYGFDKEFLHRYPKLYDLTQKELFDLSKEYNLFMYQTHPFRDGVTAGDPQYLHGAESFNGHYHHRNKNALANEFCDRYNLIKMSGTDFHHADQPITAGIYIPDDINTNRELTDYLLKGNFERIEQKDDYKQALVDHKKTQGIIIDINDKEL